MQSRNSHCYFLTTESAFTLAAPELNRFASVSIKSFIKTERYLETTKR